MNVAIIDYGMGNVESVSKSLSYLNLNSHVTRSWKNIVDSDVIIIPGVGSFRKGMDNLNKFGLVDLLKEEVLVKKKPCLGICLGMQLMASIGTEPEKTVGLGFVQAEVLKIENKLRIPHMGWNEINLVKSNFLGNEFDKKDFYFIHSYHLVPNDKGIISSYVNYGNEIVSSIESENIFATQFHPEKSQKMGLMLLNNFFKKVC